MVIGRIPQFHALRDNDHRPIARFAPNRERLEIKLKDVARRLESSESRISRQLSGKPKLGREIIDGVAQLLRESGDQELQEGVP